MLEAHASRQAALQKWGICPISIHLNAFPQGVQIIKIVKDFATT
jgi:hypothetical protein